MSFSPNILMDLQDIFQYPFMQHAFEAGTIVAIIAGVIGYFVVLRRSSFAAHALSHIGFAGAAGAIVLSVSPVFGLLLFTIIGGIAMVGLGVRGNKMDVQIGVVLAFMLGLGLLFISLYRGGSTVSLTISILFGQVLGVSSYDVTLTLIAGLIILAAISIIYRPLLFASLDEDVAEARGVPLLLLGMIFIILVAVTTSIAVQVVGVLLIFSLTVTPAAIGQQLAKRPWKAMMIAVSVALFATWIGLFLAFYEPYPVSFFITTIVFGIYILVRFAYPRIASIRSRPSLKTQDAIMTDSLRN